MPKKPFMVRNALVMPLRGTLDRFTGGVFQRDSCLGETLLFRNTPRELFGLPASEGSVAEARVQGGADRLDGEYLFGGYLFRHYGHFLTETLSRVYALRQCAPVPILFSSTHREILPWQHDVFRLLGLRNPIIKLERPTIVEKLVVAEPGLELPGTLAPEQIAALGAIPVPPKTGRRLWLSRASNIGGGLLNENILHPYLQKRGWEIIHPQYYPIKEQVALIGSSARVAGIDGSAFHTALLAQTIRGRWDIFFVRSMGHILYSAIAALKGFPQGEILLRPEDGSVRFLGGQGAERFFELLDVHAVLDVLDASDHTV